MSKNLVIVESPAKAKTIEKYLGKDYVVKSSFGHVRDLPHKGMSIDIEGGTFEPTYEVSDDKKKVIAELRKAAKTATTVWLASDEDREGEAIAWHLSEALKLDPKHTKRIAFHEITKPAILHAIENPREVDQNLVDAQQARRVLDRLVGYELSPVLWRKIKTGLSAGRVQSVAVRLIVEREREIEAHEANSAFRVVVIFDLGKGKELKAELPKRFKTQEEAKTFLEKLMGAEFSIKDLETKPGKKSPAAPFTTSTLQQEASRKLGFSVKQTMVVAQRLYEQGKITYMRTDSVNLADIALAQAAQEIESRYGKEYVQVRKYKTKSSNAQEAHEAIRPTKLDVDTVGGEHNEQRLYDLIWKRTVASQMAEAKIEKTQATITISTTNEELVAKGEVIRFEGFLKVYLEGHDRDEEEEKNALPPLEKGQVLKLSIATARETFDRPPARYTEASLVKKLEEEGIGRPSTYAPTISTIQDRGYVEKADSDGHEREYAILTLEKEKLKEETATENTGVERAKLFPTDMGKVVNDFLVAHFADVVDYSFTVKVEEEFDRIAAGKEKWNTMIRDFYKGFHKSVEGAADVSREEASQTRELGTDPESGKPVLVRVGRYGLMVQIGHATDDEKPKFASLLKGQKLETITLEEALALFEFPKVLGQDAEGRDIAVARGRFGPYVHVEKTYVSIKEEQLHTLTLEEGMKLIKEKLEEAAKKVIQDFGDIQVLNGRYGPYVTNGKKNAKIPKEQKPEKLTEAECKELIEKAPAKGKGRFARKKR